jgi:hypothetical protein
MIEFTRDEEKFKVLIESGVLNHTYHLTFNCNSVPYAELLRMRMQEGLRPKLEEIRKEAYLDGYKDGRAKRGKKNWFKRWW